MTKTSMALFGAGLLCIAARGARADDAPAAAPTPSAATLDVSPAPATAVAPAPVAAPAPAAAAQPQALPVEATRAPSASLSRATPRLSGQVATTLAIGGTLAAWSITVAGFPVFDVNESLGSVMVGGGFLASTVAPSLGHLYAGEYRHTLTFSLLRTGTIGLIWVGAALSFSFYDSDPDTLDYVGEGMVGLGLVGTLALSAYDWYDAHRAVARYNRRLGPELSVAPMLGGDVRGLVLGGSF